MMLPKGAASPPSTSRPGHIVGCIINLPYCKWHNDDDDDDDDDGDDDDDDASDAS